MSGCASKFTAGIPPKWPPSPSPPLSTSSDKNIKRVGESWFSGDEGNGGEWVGITTGSTSKAALMPLTVGRLLYFLIEPQKLHFFRDSLTRKPSTYSWAEWHRGFHDNKMQTCLHLSKGINIAFVERTFVLIFFFFFFSKSDLDGVF